MSVFLKPVHKASNIGLFADGVLRHHKNTRPLRC